MEIALSWLFFMVNTDASAEVRTLLLWTGNHKCHRHMVQLANNIFLSNLLCLQLPRVMLVVSWREFISLSSFLWWDQREACNLHWIQKWTSFDFCCCLYFNLQEERDLTQSSPQAKLILRSCRSSLGNPGFIPSEGQWCLFTWSHTAVQPYGPQTAQSIGFEVLQCNFLTC